MSKARIWIIVAAVLVVGGVAGVVTFGGQRETTNVELASLPPKPRSVSRLSGKDALALANRWREQHPSIMTSLTTTTVDFVFPNAAARKVDLPDDIMAVAIAPYVNRTHPCAVHSMTKCEGELPNRNFDVTVTDSAGNVVIDETLQTMSNGFLEIWLPRNEQYEVQVAGVGKSSTQPVATFEDSPTCRTDFKLT